MEFPDPPTAASRQPSRGPHQRPSRPVLPPPPSPPHVWRVYGLEYEIRGPNMLLFISEPLLSELCGLGLVALSSPSRQHTLLATFAGN